MKRLLILLSVLILLLVIFVFETKTTKNKSWAEINGKVFEVSLAKTDQEKEKGLSIYNSLPENQGMIFVFQTPNYYAFWMKDMKFPIDIIFINKNRIIDIYKNAKPPKNKDEELPLIRPREKSDTVLEINAGLSDKYNFKIGDMVKINY